MAAHADHDHSSHGHSLNAHERMALEVADLDAEDDDRIPVTILTGWRSHFPNRDYSLSSSAFLGFLGAGKTTLLNHILTEHHGNYLLPPTVDGSLAHAQHRC